MSANLWPVDAVGGSPSYTGRALRQAALGVLLGGGGGSRPLAGRSGVNPRTPSTTVSATSTTWTVQPHAGVVDAEASALAGAYAYSFDTAQTGAVTAANGSNDRIDLISVQVSDPAEGDGSSTPSVAVVYTAGVAAGSPSPPATPARSLALAQIRVPKVGTGSPVVTWVARNMAAAGGLIVAATSAAYPATPFDGDAVYDQSSDTILVYNGATWRSYLPACSRQVKRSTTLTVPDSTTTSPNSWPDAGFNVGDIAYSAGVFTPGTAGLYRWACSIEWPATTTTHSRQQFVLKNGVTAPEGKDARSFFGAVGPQSMSSGGEISLAAGDTVELGVTQTSGGSLAVTPRTFSLVLCGAGA